MAGRRRENTQLIFTSPIAPSIAPYTSPTPSGADTARAAEAGVAPGGDIMIQGLPNGFSPLGSAHRIRDWTAGCIAVTDSEIDEIWILVEDGTPIEIRP
jgi:murein L,D-transpeptidase YafK